MKKELILTAILAAVAATGWQQPGTCTDQDTGRNNRKGTGSSTENAPRRSER